MCQLLLRPDCLVMRYTGTDINRLLYTDAIASADYPVLFLRLFNDLACLHAAGQWHGGAQARNITCCDKRLYRIDFEENIGNAVPLALAQAYDLVLLFSSLADYLLDNETLADELLQQYLAVAGNTGLRHRLEQIRRWLARLLKIEPLLSKKLRQKSDVRRIKLLAATLDRSLCTR